MKIVVSNPKYRPAITLTQTDVFPLMVVASSDQYCPHFGDRVPYKSVTVKIPEHIYLNAELLTDVLYWLEYVLGADCVSKSDNDENNNLFIRADYKCF